MSFGSQRGFAYTTDQGTVYAVRLDESNTELVNGVSPIPPSNSTAIPPDIKRRSVGLKAADGSTKTVVILTRAIFDSINIGQSFASPTVGDENAPGTSFVVTRKKPESVFRRVTSLDTGKIDGDQP